MQKKERDSAQPEPSLKLEVVLPGTNIEGTIDEISAFLQLNKRDTLLGLFPGSVVLIDKEALQRALRAGFRF